MDRKRYNLNMPSCYLSVFYNAQQEIQSISFDVEKADDYHYQIEADQLPKLCEFLKCKNNEENIVDALKKQMMSWKDPIEIATLCRKADVKFQCHYWY